MPKIRERNIEFIKQKLLRQSLPRVQVSVILLLTALAGFLTSFGLLQAGVSLMAVRYPTSIFVAYCVFLLLLRVWLWLQKSRNNLNVDFNISSMDLGFTASNKSDFEFGGGGDFSGAGAGGSWSSGVSTRSSLGDSSFLDNVSFDLEEFSLLIIAFVALIGGLLASLYIIYIAPVLLAEILVDGVLVSVLYRRVKGAEQKYWLQTAIKRTLLPAILAALFFSVAGYAMQKAVPKAHSIGEVWKFAIEK